MVSLFTEIAKRVALAAEIEEKEKKYKKRITELEEMCDYLIEMCKKLKVDRDYADLQLRIFQERTQKYWDNSDGPDGQDLIIK